MYLHDLLYRSVVVLVSCVFMEISSYSYDTVFDSYYLYAPSTHNVSKLEDRSNIGSRSYQKVDSINGSDDRVNDKNVSFRSKNREQHFRSYDNYPRRIRRLRRDFNKDGKIGTDDSDNVRPGTENEKLNADKTQTKQSNNKSKSKPGHSWRIFLQQANKMFNFTPKKTGNNNKNDYSKYSSTSRGNDSNSPKSYYNDASQLTSFTMNQLNRFNRLFNERQKSRKKRNVSSTDNLKYQYDESYKNEDEKRSKMVEKINQLITNDQQSNLQFIEKEHNFLSNEIPVEKSFLYSKLMDSDENHSSRKTSEIESSSDSTASYIDDNLQYNSQKTYNIFNQYNDDINQMLNSILQIKRIEKRQQMENFNENSNEVKSDISTPKPLLDHKIKIHNVYKYDEILKSTITPLPVTVSEKPHVDTVLIQVPPRTIYCAPPTRLAFGRCRRVW